MAQQVKVAFSLSEKKRSESAILIKLLR